MTILEICFHDKLEKRSKSPEVKLKHKYDSVNTDFIPLYTRITVADIRAKPLKIIQISVNTQSNSIIFQLLTVANKGN